MSAQHRCARFLWCGTWRMLGLRVWLRVGAVQLPQGASRGSPRMLPAPSLPRHLEAKARSCIAASHRAGAGETVSLSPDLGLCRDSRDLAVIPLLPWGKANPCGSVLVRGDGSRKTV